MAQLQHPHIVQVYEIGEADGCPFFSLEFVDGGSLAKLLQSKSLSPAVAAKLIRTLALAMQYAHDRGIVHRDLKPANILLQRIADNERKTHEAGRKPSTIGAIKITDFGLAKQLDESSGRTATGSILGTPSYMAPEQASGRSRDIGTAADVYALGAILYELLTGRPPFKADTVLDTLEQVRTQEPVPPRQIKSTVPKDLETICLKCLQKDIEKRYPSARDLAEDLRRYAVGEPIAARPCGRVERAWRWCRRKPLLAALGAVILVSVFAGTILLTYGWVQAGARAEADRLRDLEKVQRIRAEEQQARAEQQQTRAEQQQTRAEQQQTRAERQEQLARQYMYFSKIHAAQRAWQDGQLARMDELLEETKPAHTNNKDLRGFEWHYLQRLGNQNQITLKEHTAEVTGVAFSRDGSRFASSSLDGTIVVYDGKTNRKVQTLRGNSGGVTCLAFSPDGARLLGGFFVPGVGAKVWNVATGEVTLSLKGHRLRISAVAFSPDSRLIATASYDTTVRVWDALTGKEIFTYRGHEGSVNGLAFSPDNRCVASCGGDSFLRLWQVTTGQVAGEYRRDSSGISVCFSPGGLEVAEGWGEGGVNIWDIATGRRSTLEGHTAWVSGIVFSRDGKRLATSSHDMTVRVWDAHTRRELLTLRGHRAGVNGVAFSPDGDRLVTGSRDGKVKVWPIGGGMPHVFPTPGYNCAVSIHADGRRIGYGGTSKGAEIRDLTNGKVLMTIPHGSQILALASSPDGKRFAVAGMAPVVKVWQVGPKMLELRGHTSLVWDLAFSPDSRRLATASNQDHTFKVWDVESGKELYSVTVGDLGPNAVVFSPDGKKLAVGLYGIRVCEAATGRELQTLKEHTDYVVIALAYSHNGRYLASGSWDGTVTLWDSAAGVEIRTFKGHTNPVYKVLFSPDDRRIFSCSADRTIRIWDVASGQEALTLRGHSGSIRGIALTKDGHRLVSASGDGTVRLWDGSP